jgi:membrane peptidoglycan carboxypeptidase
MSEHRRKPPQGRGRRAAQPPSGRRAAPPRGETTGSYGYGHRPGPPEPPEPTYGSRAEARRAAQRGGRRRAAGAVGMEGAAGRGRGHEPPAKKRLLDYPRSGKYGWRRWMPSWKQTLGTFVGFCALMLGLTGAAFAMVDVPNPNDTALSQKNVYYWNDGTRMVAYGGQGSQNRQSVKLGKISKNMQNAVIAAENASFYTDSGIDPKGIARAIVNMAMGGETQSGSTITQQYVKNMYLSQNQTLSRKVKEMVISVKVGTQQSKDQILDGYLNTAYYGRGAFGIEAAAQAYYGVHADQLTLSQSAFLAATVNGPNLYDPYGGVPGVANQSKEKNRKRAEARWKWILHREAKVAKMPNRHGAWPSDADVQKAIAKKFPMPDKPKKSADLEGQIGYLVQLADRDVTQHTDISMEQLKKGGYQIYTTFDKKKVDKLENTVKAARKKSLDPKKREKDKYVQFGGASVKPGDGAIEAIYGGVSATKHYTSNAVYTGAAVGSTFKPFVLAAAFTHGVRDPQGGPEQPDSERIPVSPKTIYNGDSGIKILNYNGQPWMNKEGKEWLQPNEGDTNYGPMTLRDALKVSANTPFVQLGMDVGLDKVRHAAELAGVDKDHLNQSDVPSFSIGISTPSAIEMANGYATFDNHGVWAEPYSVKQVKKQGAPVYTHHKKTRQAFDANVSDTITSMLQTVVQKGTGTKALALHRDSVAGKTGTTDGNKQAWFTGYTPKLATSIGMWRMNDNPQKGDKTGFLSMKGVAGLPQIHGASFPEEIWTAYMKEALQGVPEGHFTPPQPMDAKKFCAHKACPSPSPSPSASPSESPSGSPSPTPSQSVPVPNPSDTCQFMWNCQNGGQTGGTTGGPSGSPTPTGGTNGGPGGGNGGTNGNNGGIFGGPTGAAKQPQ